MFINKNEYKSYLQAENVFARGGTPNASNKV